MASAYTKLKTDPYFFTRQSSFYHHLQSARERARYSRMVMLTVPLDDQEYYEANKRDYDRYEDDSHHFQMKHIKNNYEEDDNQSYYSYDNE